MLFPGLLPGERLTWLHVAGACRDIAGAAGIVTCNPGGLPHDERMGLGLAFLAALTWSAIRCCRAGTSRHAALLPSALILIVAGMAHTSPRIAIAALVTTAGAALAARAGAWKD